MFSTFFFLIGFTFSTFFLVKLANFIQSKQPLLRLALRPCIQLESITPLSSKEYRVLVLFCIFFFFEFPYVKNKILTSPLHGSCGLALHFAVYHHIMEDYAAIKWHLILVLEVLEEWKNFMPNISLVLTPSFRELCFSIANLSFKIMKCD